MSSNSLYHEHQTSPMLDVRFKQDVSGVSGEEVYYMVHRVRVGNAEWFRHSSIIADSHDYVGLGSEQVVDSILREIGPAKHRANIDLVLVRNLIYSDAEIQQALEQCGINDAVDNLKSAAQPSQYIVVGKIGPDQLFTIAAQSTSAMQAIERTAQSVRKQHGKPFQVLSVCLMGDYVGELENAYAKAAVQLRQLIDLVGSDTPH